MLQNHPSHWLSSVLEWSLGWALCFKNYWIALINSELNLLSQSLVIYCTGTYNAIPHNAVNDAWWYAPSRGWAARARDKFYFELPRGRVWSSWLWGGAFLCNPASNFKIQAKSVSFLFCTWESVVPREISCFINRSSGIQAKTIWRKKSRDGFFKDSPLFHVIRWEITILTLDL